VLLQLAGLGLVVIGSWLLVDDKAVNFLGIASDDKHGFKVAAAIVIVVGILSMLITFIGCWGALGQKTSCLNIVSLCLCFSH